MQWSLTCVGALVIICGQIGAGKSTLLRALLKEAECLRGDMMLEGRVGYGEPDVEVHAPDSDIF